MDQRSLLRPRMCPNHALNPVSNLCLRSGCSCQHFICSQCLRESHKNAPNCAIMRTQPPLSLCNVNSKKMEHFSDFQRILGKVSEIWESGSQMMQNQLEGIQNDFLLPINAMCKTFAEETPEELQRSLLNKEEAEAETLINIQILKLFANNRNKLQHVELIKNKSESVAEKVCYMLLKSFQELQNNLAKINGLIREQSIFDIEVPLQYSSKEPEKTSASSERQSTKIVALEKVEQKLLESMKEQVKAQNALLRAKTGQNIFILTKQTENELQNLKQQVTALHIKSCSSSDTLLDKFLNMELGGVRDLVVQTPSAASQSVIPLLLSLFSNLRSVSFNCDNEFYKCQADIVLSDAYGKERSLDRLEYFYEYRRYLEGLDESIYFKQQKLPLETSLKIHFFNYKQQSYWSTFRKTLPAQELAQSVLRFKQKNLWLQQLDEATVKTFERQGLNFSNFEDLTFGCHLNPSSHIPLQLQKCIKTARNLKCLVFIKSVHLATNLLEMFKSANQLEVLVLDEFICSGDLNQQQALYESLPKCCPLLKKLWVSNLKVINIGFIADLRQLQTLILPTSSNLEFKSQKRLDIAHLNLFSSSWNYLSLLSKLDASKLHYLNLGDNSLPNLLYDLLMNFLLTCTNLRCICLDRMKLSAEVNSLIDNNRMSLEKLSLFNCKPQDGKILLQTIYKCEALKILDVNSCGSIEQEILKKIPASLEALTVSRSALNKMLALGLKPSTKCTIIEIQ